MYKGFLLGHKPFLATVFIIQLPQGVGLAYLQTRISGVFLGVLNFKNLYFFWVLLTAAVFLGLLNKSCILKCFIFSTVFFGSSFIHQALQ